MDGHAGPVTGQAAIDWGAPWYQPWRDSGERVAGRWEAGLPLPDALNREAGSPVRFVAQQELVPGEPYERHIFRSGDCPTRDNLHDFFNGLCWLLLPEAKKQLNRLQASQIDSAGPGAARGAVRDAITVLDENGALLHAPAPVWEALLAREWRRLFVDLRPLWAQARLLVFGHALLEKLAGPRKALTAHVLRSPAPDLAGEELDRWLAGQLTAEHLAGKPFTPLPVLGVPGWWPENQNFSFYDDSFVFRPAGRRQIQNNSDAANPPLICRGPASSVRRGELQSPTSENS